jgi:hypothetical protein
MDLESFTKDESHDIHLRKLQSNMERIRQAFFEIEASTRISSVGLVTLATPPSMVTLATPPSIVAPEIPPIVITELQLSHRTVSSSGLIISSDTVVLVNAAGGTLAVTMPNPVICDKKVLFIKKVDTTANKVTINGAIDGKTSVVLTFPWQCVMLHSTGTAWQLIGGFP